jgi:hypothetical protein
MRIEKTKLLALCQSLQFSGHADSAIWHLDKSGLYSVHSLYKFLNSGGIHVSLRRSVWKLPIPLKVIMNCLFG